RAVDRAAARRPGSGSGACNREVLRHFEGRQERLPDRDLVVRRHLQEGRSEGCLAQRAQGHLRENRRRLARLQQGVTATPSAAASGSSSRCSTRPVQPAFPGRRPNQPEDFAMSSLTLEEQAYEMSLIARVDALRTKARRFPLSVLEFGMRLA